MDAIRRIVYHNTNGSVVGFLGIKTIQQAITNVVNKAYFNRYNKHPSEGDVIIHFPINKKDEMLMSPICMPLFFHREISGTVSVFIEEKSLVVEFKSNLL